MKRLFKAVRQNDLETIQRILDAKPELINCVAIPPPKKDEEQSLLQVANKAGKLEIAHYLIDKGIDLNYMEPDHGLPWTQCYTCPVLIDTVDFLLSGNIGWQSNTEERMKLVLHLLEKGADPNKTDNRNCNAWDHAINTYCDARGSIRKSEEGKSFAALFQKLLDILYPYVDILDIDRVNNDLKIHENYSLFLKNLILNRDDLYGVTPETLGTWEKRWLPIIPLVKPFYRKDNPNYEDQADCKRILFKEQNRMSKQPHYPFDITGYTCFSIINCPVEQAIQLLKEYSDICAAEDRCPVSFQIAAIPEAEEWTLLRWSRPGRFYDLMNLTMWLRGCRADLGGENPIFVALPPIERMEEGPFLARPDYNNRLGDSMLGFWQNWSFDYIIPEEKMRWIGENVFPQEYFFNGYGYSSTGFKLEWLRHSEGISDWAECTILMEK